MFSILKDKFFTNHVQTNKTYYTGAMIKMTGIEQNETSLALTNSFNTLVMNPVDTEETVNVQLEYERETRKENQWVIDRYLPQVNEELLNNIGDSSEMKISESTALSIFWDKNVSILAESRNAIGTAEELEYRYLWIARKNCADAINSLYKREVGEQLSYLNKWYIDALTKNKENLLKAIAAGKFISTEYNFQKLTESGEKKFYSGEDFYRRNSEDEDTFCRKFYKREHNILDVSVFNEWEIKSHTVLFQKDTKNLKYGWKYGCFINAGAPAVVATFKVTSPEAIADLCNCKVSDLPELLQHFNTSREFCDGNYILKNMDLMDWAIRNHIADFESTVSVLLSKKAYNNLLKENNMPPNKIWLNNNE